MAGQRISDLPTKSDAADDDVVVGVDVSDTTESEQGTTKAFKGTALGSETKFDQFRIDEADYTDLGFSDEFDGGLKSFWTASSDISAGTVDLTVRKSSTIYDLTSVPGSLLIQATGGPHGFRADFVPGDGEEVVVALGVGGTDVANNNTAGAEIALNDDDSAPNSGTFVQIYYDGENNGNLKVYDGGAIIQTMDTGIVGRRFYIRIINSGGTLYFVFSVNGEIWRMVATKPASNYTNFWITGDSEGGNVSPVIGYHWVRHVAYNGFLPFQ